MTSSEIRKEVASIGKHSAIYVVGQALSQAVGFFMIPVYTRFISPTDYGALDLVEIVIGALGLVLSLGVMHSMSRYYYAEREERSRSQVVTTIVVGFALIGLVILLGALLLAGTLAKTLLGGTEYALPLTLMIAACWFGLQCQIGLTYLRMRYMAKTFVAVTTAHLVIALSLNIVLVAFFRLGMLGVCWSTLISQALVGGTLTAGILLRLWVRPSFRLLSQLVRFGLPLVPLRLVAVLGSATNRLVLRYYSSPDPAIALAHVGLFSLGNKFGVAVNRFFNVPFNSFWSPRRLQLICEDDQAALPTIARVCTYSTLLAAFLGLLVASGAENVIQIMAAEEYHGAHTVVPILALAYVVLGLDNQFLTGILHRKKTIWATVASLLSLAVLLAASFVLIPVFGLPGAALAHLSGFSVRTLLLYVLNQRTYPIPFEIGRIWALLGVACSLYVITRYVAFESPLWELLARELVASTFPFMLYILRWYRREELSAINEVVREWGRKLWVRDSAALGVRGQSAARAADLATAPATCDPGDRSERPILEVSSPQSTP